MKTRAERESLSPGAKVRVQGEGKNNDGSKRHITVLGALVPDNLVCLVVKERWVLNPAILGFEPDM
jgi:hypothetical protein